MEHSPKNKNWDLIVIGGGITGAGVLREATKSGLKTLLLEQNDFAWGTSSRTSKLVHGGLRYLKEGRIFLTIESVRERERLLKEAPGLVDPIPFFMPIYGNKGPKKLVLEAGLTLYDLFALKKRHKFIQRDPFQKMEKHLDPSSLKGGFEFMDAQIDDARLVLRVIDEASQNGGSALNYTKVKKILRDSKGFVKGVVAVDTETGEESSFHTQAIINATGTWAETLHPSPQKGLHLRPLRGSHIFFSPEDLPVRHAMGLIHPADKRPLFVIPWEGAVLVGTTDIDHSQDLSQEPAIRMDEATYLMEGVNDIFPDLKISLKDALSTITGIRPVLSKGNLDPSKESREHVVWVNKGLVTITGGKLTTFRKLAWDALKAIKPFLSTSHLKGEKERVFSKTQNKFSPIPHIEEWKLKRLYGRYGNKAEIIIRKADKEDLSCIPGSMSLWAELSYAAENENIRHLSDLLLRRVRVGLVTPEGGKPHMEKIRKQLDPILPWTNEKWEKEIKQYYKIWRMSYSLPQ